MKKSVFLTLITIIIAAALSFSSCGSTTVPTDTAKDKETDASSVTSADTTAETAAAHDFSNARVSGYILLTSDSEKKLSDFAESSEFSVQKPEVAEVLDDGTVRALSDGVSLIEYKTLNGEDKAIACCVLEKGVRPDSSGSSPQLFEVGKSTSVSGSANRDSHYSSSNEAVAAVDENAQVSFISPGYAVITVEGVSVPSFQSYIVYEK